jgi:hypothetical protein
VPRKSVVAVVKSYQGLFANRYASEPLEEAFALAWQEINELAGGSHSHMAFLMDPANRDKMPLTEHEKSLSNTLIQWLGSPVGQGFIARAAEHAAAKKKRKRS